MSGCAVALVPVGKMRSYLSRRQRQYQASRALASINLEACYWKQGSTHLPDSPVVTARQRGVGSMIRVGEVRALKIFTLHEWQRYGLILGRWAHQQAPKAWRRTALWRLAIVLEYATSSVKHLQKMR